MTKVLLPARFYVHRSPPIDIVNVLDSGDTIQATVNVAAIEPAVPRNGYIEISLAGRYSKAPVGNNSSNVIVFETGAPGDATRAGVGFNSNGVIQGSFDGAYHTIVPIVNGNIDWRLGPSSDPAVGNKHGQIRLIGW